MGRRTTVRLACFLSVFAALFVFLASTGRATAAQSQAIPAWLNAYVGDEDGKISLVVLQRAREFFLKKARAGDVRNPCYFAMDATRPSDLGNDQLGRRFYVICEADKSFRAIASGHGSGRNLKGYADFANGRRCAKNFGNALDSNLTTGGEYETAEEKTSFKGYYRTASGKDEAYVRSFIQFDGDGETSTARKRAIGGHPAQVLRGLCMKKMPDSPYAKDDGLVPVGKLVDYAGGRSNGCTSWSAADAKWLMPLIRENPTTLYVYPQSSDVQAVARAVKSRRSPAQQGLYWNASCLSEIGAPRFWPADELGPVIARYEVAHPTPEPKPLPLCKP
ncbi:hypothetical protein [Aestuariivirga sp.]|uniref:hypothetical protein n=1 Tax=Aestuariivirga sp. TaxID=2650926 RepID=UPI003BA962B6